jgi:hypothetical protein
MFHQYTDDLDCPPQLEAFYDLGYVFVPWLIAGASAAATATIGSWLGTRWNVGIYNDMTSKIDNTFKQWNTQGWEVPEKGPNACWKKHPAMRAEFMALWKRWSDHYGKYGKQSGFLSDDAEDPIRRNFLPELKRLAEWLNTTCKFGTDPSPIIPPPSNGGNGGDDTTSDIAGIVKWGVIGIGLVFALNVYQSTRGPRRY